MPPWRLRRGRRGGESGQSLVEFALVLPLLLVLLFALVDFGRGFQAWIQVTNGAREGARVGAVRGTAAQIESRVRSATAGLDQSKLSVAASNVQGAPGQSVVVTVSYRWDLITPVSPLLGLLSGGSVAGTLTLRSAADMRLE